MFIISFVIGLIIVISSIFMLRKELNNAMVKRSSLIEQAGIYKREDLIETLESLQLTINEMNNAFYEIIGQIEGNVSVHDKLISDLESRVEACEALNHAVDLEKHKLKQEISVNLRQMSEMKVSKPDSGSASTISAADTIVNHLDEQMALEKALTATVTTDGRLETVDRVNRSKLSEDEEPSTAKKIEQIITMRSQGYSLTEIAKKLGMGMGEIQLLINMKHKK